jgi:hypothetical protein
VTDEPTTAAEAPETVEPTKPPTKPHELSDEQLEQARAWVRERWSALVCPFHGPTNWGLQRTLGQIPSYQMSLGPAPVFPALVFVCETCGNMVLVNALTAGVLTAPDQGG